jgi:hypothetical protein
MVLARSRSPPWPSPEREAAADDLDRSVESAAPGPGESEVVVRGEGRGVVHQETRPATLVIFSRTTTRISSGGSTG